MHAIPRLGFGSVKSLISSPLRMCQVVFRLFFFFFFFERLYAVMMPNPLPPDLFLTASAIANEDYFLCHSGLSPEMVENVSVLHTLDRRQEHNEGNLWDCASF
jgi:hypothetical protein